MEASAGYIIYASVAIVNKKGNMPEWLMGMTRNHMASAAQVQILLLSSLTIQLFIFVLRSFLSDTYVLL